MKLDQRNILILAAIILALVLFSKKGKAMFKKAKETVSNTEKTIDKLWRDYNASEFTKEVWYQGQKWQAQVKNIKGYDVALLANNKVVIFETDYRAWMPAGIQDLK